MHFADSIFIFLLALILFGPKKLPEIGRQIGKLLVEFRRASNEFKSQIDEELRTMEQQERQKKLEQAALPAAEMTSQPNILPPSTGMTVSASQPYGQVTPPELPTEISSTEQTGPRTPIMEAQGVDTQAAETPTAAVTGDTFSAPDAAPVTSHGTNGHTSSEPIEAGNLSTEPENAQASIHHG
ncbi:sec-independent protein translocase protein TatB [Silvibacterium bohemicum]|uniref:Sec-independent protein translocase protein TatB n=1 Tax=Silvibacterium bohemicum TaxID=1577686 RepID=A0A841JWB8_9BACT|nr:twin-arginine translocase TatA/TatE family subunit [Silvibacterium bohemicum]MBB6143271.1 sec-independent protein translocase protein TatB [Silvibacterium bohemicum]